MPPVKKYEFESLTHPNVKIEIWSLGYESAQKALIETVINPKNYKSINL